MKGNIALAIIVIVVSMVFLSLFTARLNGRRGNFDRIVGAEQEMVKLLDACKGFQKEYGNFPIFSNESAELSNIGIVRALQAQDTQQNPKGIWFLEVRKAVKIWNGYANGIDPKNGVFLDPWGNPYYIKIIKSGIEIRSAGPDRVPWNSDDLILTESEVTRRP